MEYSDFTVVIPTLNEEENISILLGHLLSSYKGINIIIADGGSSDKTRGYVEKIAKKSGHVRFLENRSSKLRRSVTHSVIDGILASRTKYVIVMDADMQHPYAVVKKMARLLKQGNQIVPAVRGSISNWGLNRLIISKMLNYVGYAMLVLRNKERCSDVSTGFFGMDRKLFTSIYSANKNRYVINGIRIFYDTIKCIAREKFRVAEVRYDFKGREEGHSKIGFSHGVKAIKSIFT